MTYKEYDDSLSKCFQVLESYRVRGLHDCEWGYYGKVGGNAINGVPIAAARHTAMPSIPASLLEDMSAELKWLGVNVLFTVWAPDRVSWVFANADEVDAAWRGGDSASCVFVCDHWQREVRS